MKPPGHDLMESHSSTTTRHCRHGHWCWTGQRPVAYDDDLDRLEKLAAIARGAVTALRDVWPWPFPEFEDAITACLAPDPAARPTVKELTAAW
ncbi:protein kinase family protein [Streptomyces albidoflavus]|uniref:hypothetical protein n=1 Tax=Streptomyces albidoflavus TaxID=1886 RepID=UPI0033FF8469